VMTDSSGRIFATQSGVPDVAEVKKLLEQL
jgi:hypothetical protein